LGLSRSPTNNKEKIMRKDRVLKGLLAVSTVAAMFSAYGVQAQAVGHRTADMSAQSGSSSTAGNTNSQGSSGTSGSTGTSGAGTGQTSGSAASQGATSAGAAAASGSAGGSLSKSDQKILMGMAQANIDEVEAGKMAQSKSQNDQVKSFAQQMIDDHSKALTDAQQVAQQKGVTLPTEPDAKHKAMAAKLEKMNGAAFDKAYMANAGIADHKKVLSTLQADQKRAKDADVKALAAKMTPVVAQHLKAAQQIGTPKSGTTSGQ
jgi:putative membrane protein